MSRKPEVTAVKVVILTVPDVQMLDVVGPMDVFSEANIQLGSPTAYQVRLVALTPDAVQAENGMRFLPDASVKTALGAIDTLLVAGSPRIQAWETHPELLAWIKKHAPRARRTGSICTGAFLLGHAGLLNGRHATTHWKSTTRLTELFAKVQVDPNRIYIKDGPIYTSAGVTASMDLALALVEEDHGREVALRVAKKLILFLKRPGGQSQFSMQLEAQIADQSPVRALQEWILEHLNQDLSVEALAARMKMSSRNFARLFKRETGATPGDYVEAARVEAAKRILEEGDTHLKKVASLCGFTDPGGLRRAFARHLRVTPIEYRQRFQAGHGL